MKRIHKLISHHEKYISLIRDSSDNVTIRNQLAKSMDGYGLKEASHAMRNLGRGQGIATVDRHILRVAASRIENISELCTSIITKEVGLTESRYLIIEKAICEYGDSIGIPHEFLDMIWWSEYSGEFFK